MIRLRILILIICSGFLPFTVQPALAATCQSGGKVFSESDIVWSKYHKAHLYCAGDSEWRYLAQWGLMSSGDLVYADGNVGIATGKMYQIDGEDFIGIGTGDVSTLLGLNAQAAGLGTTAIGNMAGYMSTGSLSTLVGHGAGMNNTGGSQTSVGIGAGANNTGDNQASLGLNAGGQNKGDRQTAIGSNAGLMNSGHNQIAIGTMAGQKNTGNNVVAIGYLAGVDNTLDNQFILKQGGINVMPLMQGDFATGRIGIGTTTPGTALDVAGDIRASNSFRLSNVGAFADVTGLGNARLWAAERLELGAGGSGGHMLTIMQNGNIDINNNRLLRVADPVDDTDAVNKLYADMLGGRTSCNNGQLLKWDGNSWECANDNMGFMEGGGAGTTMIPDWPDAITCKFTNTSTSQIHTVAFYVDGSDPTNSRFYYSRIYTDASNPVTARSHRIVFNMNGTYHSSENVPTIYAVDCHDDGLSIPQLYADKRAFNFVGGGSGAGGGQDVSFYAYRELENNQTVATSTYVAAAMTHKEYDTTNAFNLTTGRFNPKMAGKYLIGGTIYCAGSMSTGCDAYIRKNGTATSYGYASTGGQGHVALTSAIVSMNGTTDYVELVGRNRGSTVFGGNATTFYGALLGSGGGLGGGSSSMLAGWPDAISCQTSGFNNVMFYLVGNTADTIFYRHIMAPGHPTNLTIGYNPDGTYKSSDGAAGYDCVTDASSISELYADNRAFTFGGGSGGSGGSGSSEGEGVFAVLVGNQSIPTTLQTTVKTNNVIYNHLSGYNGSTGIFTAPRNGWYQISGTIQWAQLSDNTNSGMLIYANGYTACLDFGTGGNVDKMQNCSASMYLPAGSTAEMRAWHYEGNPEDIEAARFSVAALNGVGGSGSSGSGSGDSVPTLSGSLPVITSGVLQSHYTNYVTLPRGVYLGNFYNCLSASSSNYFISMEAEANSGIIQSDVTNRYFNQMVYYDQPPFVFRVQSENASVRFRVWQADGGTITNPNPSCASFEYSQISSGSSGGSGDNLGNHTATKNVNLNGNMLSGDGGNEGIFIDANGNVGIGTTTPRSILDINNFITMSGGANAYYGFGAIPQNQLPEGDLDLTRDMSSSSGGANNPILRLNGHTGVSLSAHSNYGGIRFYNQGYSNDIPDGAYRTVANAQLVMSVTNGAVGIGTTAPQSNLHIVGPNNNGLVAPLRITSGSQEMLIDGNEISTTEASGNMLYFQHYTTNHVHMVGGGGRVGIGGSPTSYKLQVYGTAYATGAAGALSDRRHKHHIETLDNGALDIISRLRPVTFEWNDPVDAGMEGKQLGFIAQEVEEILPEIILTQDDDEQTKGLKPTAIIPVLVKAMQELKAENDALRAVNDDFRRELDELKAVIGE